MANVIMSLSLNVCLNVSQVGGPNSNWYLLSLAARLPYRIQCDVGSIGGLTSYTYAVPYRLISDLMPYTSLSRRVYEFEVERLEKNRASSQMIIAVYTDGVDKVYAARILKQ